MVLIDLTIRIIIVIGYYWSYATHDSYSYDI